MNHSSGISAPPETDPQHSPLSFLGGEGSSSFAEEARFLREVHETAGRSGAAATLFSLAGSRWCHLSGKSWPYHSVPDGQRVFGIAAHARFFRRTGHMLAEGSMVRK
ncbi:hypothetical protein Bca52824_064348 [Brassica carinata]|uniref:Uncharacterized protein n=1 Tax=Brassica carinata TaxID=52824 RepID=A0A8X7QKX7_BRACI|nr:hypothetical protein Bca52824_064348 [Brassica carinata]